MGLTWSFPKWHKLGQGSFDTAFGIDNLVLVQLQQMQHLGDRWTARNNSIGEHFSSPDHSIADMTFSVIEKLNRNDIRKSFIL